MPRRGEQMPWNPVIGAGSGTAAEGFWVKEFKEPAPSHTVRGPEASNAFRPK